MFTFDEQIFQGSLPIKYVYEKGDLNQDHLIVVFSGFNVPKNKAKEEIKHTYNYIRTLRNLDCHKLFILDDYGPRGSYYLGNKEENGVEESIEMLIATISKKNGITKKNIITAGSSKGGSAALYYGLKYGFGKIVIGAPQTKISDYVESFATETFHYMLGETPSTEERENLNSIISKQVRPNVPSEIRLLTSENDIQYKKHIIPFVGLLEENDVHYHVEVNNDIQSHGEIAEHFPKYLTLNMLDIMHDVKIEDISVAQVSVSKWNIKVDSNIKRLMNFEQKLIVKANDKPVYNQGFHGECEIDLSEIGFKDTAVLEVAYTLTINGKTIVTLPIKKQFVSDGFMLMGTDFEIIDGSIHFEILIEDSPQLEYAFYIRRNNNVIEKIMYQKSRKIVYPLETTGNYQVHYFIRPKKGEKYSDRSKIIKHN
ncbi:hypothetical protein JI667_16510 [Bacillus sp. NTK074B]|uniref:accessory Sec system protein Asp2 n=1 Tax=Bacillus sp. NTK074B TaxID=2802174 RepID=UPI001A8E382F|nr:hypothetical protein [Bacillus sp. NTK074B]